MINKSMFGAITLAVVVVIGPPLFAQVKTEVPPVVPGAKPVTVEHIKIPGTSLAGNLEGDAVDRDVYVFLPPSYAKNPGATRLCMRCMVIPLVPSNGVLSG
jgi:hypothetical protein